MSEKLVPGETVKLKSGGPLMTISHVDRENDLFHCEWFDSKGELKSGEFFSTSLKIDDGNISVSFD